MFVTKKWVGKAEGTSLDQSGRWKMPRYVCFAPVHLHVRMKGTCKHIPASLIASESLWALLWGLVYCLGSGLSSSHSPLHPDMVQDLLSLCQP